MRALLLRYRQHLKGKADGDKSADADAGAVDAKSEQEAKLDPVKEREAFADAPAIVQKAASDPGSIEAALEASGGAGAQEGAGAEGDQGAAPFMSPAGDGWHHLQGGDGDWRDGDGADGAIERGESYGNFAGPGNRILRENPEAAAKKQADPSYDETKDPKYADDPRYQATDGLDAAARTHDSDYSARGKDHREMFGWEGMHAVKDADAKLVKNVNAEMDQNGDKYSKGAQTYSKGMRGFFGARVMGQDAVEWAGDKAGEAKDGIAGFAKEAQGWDSLDEAQAGIVGGAKRAGAFLEGAADEAIDGIEGAGKQIGKLGVPGAITAAAGFANVAGAGIVHEIKEGIAWLEGKLSK